MSDYDSMREEADNARQEAQGRLRTVTVRLTATRTLRIARDADVCEIPPDEILRCGDYEIEEIE